MFFKKHVTFKKVCRRPLESQLDLLG